MDNAFRLTVDKHQIAHLVFDLPGEKVNTFSLPVLEALERKLDEVAHDPEIKLLAISSAKDGVFIAGADLHSFESMTRETSSVTKMIDTGQRVFSKLEKLRIPSVALINGACLGGGLELALACTYRVVSDHPKTVLGLPEVTLGIIPGWGGTQRLPRLIGLVEALPLVLSGKPVKGNKAWKIKLADALVPAEFFNEKSREFLSYCLTQQGKQQILKRRSQWNWKQLFLEKNPFGRTYLFHRAKRDVLLRTHGHYPAPIVALELIKDTIHQPLKEGLEEEADTFKSNISTVFSNAQNLIHLFFTQEALKKEPWTTAAPVAIQSAGVIGAGTMGSAIAWLFSNRDIPVRLKDVDWTAIGKGLGHAHDLYASLLKRKKIKPNELSMKFHHLSGTTDYTGFNHLDIVVEAAVENLDLKKQIIAELESALPPHAIIGTNTSSLTLAAMSASMQNPERLVGMHFFNPANRMPLVEVVASSKTSPTAIATAVAICKQLRKTPVVVGDCPGFLVNRIFIMGSNEIMHMYEEGVPAETLETMMLQFGMPMSPFILADEVGNDICYKVGKVFEEAYGMRMRTPKLMELMYENHLYGRKNGQGFYLYKNNKYRYNSMVEKLKETIPTAKNAHSISENEMIDRVFLSMINEAARCLEENVIQNPAYLDMALIMGMGFPPFRGGLLRYADSLGIDYIVDRLYQLQERYGMRFAPCQYLIAMHHAHDTFL